MKKMYFGVFMLIAFLLYLPNQGNAQFTDVTDLAGIDIFHDGDETAEGPPMGSIIGSGAAWIDYDNDGWLDLYVTMRQGANYFYRNNGDGTFTNVAGMLGLEDADSDGSGVSAADYDNDGWIDIYLANSSGDRLFKNINGMHFTDVTSSAGFDPDEMSRGTSASWGDYDNDGYLDLYLANHLGIGYGVPIYYREDRIYHNNGDGTFTDVSNLFDLTSRRAASFIGAWVDIDNDCDLDIIQITDCPVGPATVPMKIHRNNGGTDPLNWDFEEVSQAVGAYDCKNGMGIGVGDIDHNGFMDFYFSNIGPATLYKNTGGLFTDATTPIIGGQHYGEWSWGTAIFDYDNDGWQDLMLALGDPEGRNSIAQKDYLFRNLGNGTNFADVSDLNNMGVERAHHCIYGDYDNDGDLDVFFGMYDDRCVLRRNDTNNGNNWIKIVLAGNTSNRQGIGARIKISTPDGDTQYFETRSGSNLGGGDQLAAHFGLGTNTMIDEIEVSWPNGTCDKQYLYNVDVNQTLAIMEDTNGGGTPTCTDGIQNGDEEGVDCGGTFCAPCASCNDGIQNGDEEGVDCGGTFCAPCASCDDGIQNGDEEGVDCGGSYCNPCNSCNDGIQNGDEEDVDCGGSLCPPCPTCPDNEVTLTLTLDGNGHQNSWELLDESGNEIASGGPYVGFPNGYVITESFCLPDGCYTFTINDSGGNGLCCRAGSGSYFLVDDNGNTIAGGSNIGSGETTDFCFGGGTNLAGNLGGINKNPNAFLGTSLEVYPNPVQTGDQINLAYQGKGHCFAVTVFDLNGKVLARISRDDLEKTFDLQELGISVQGVYLVQVNDGIQNFSKKILVQ